MTVYKHLEVDIAQIDITCGLIKTFSHELSMSLKENRDEMVLHKLSDLKRQIRQLNEEMKQLDSKAEYLKSFLT